MKPLSIVTMSLRDVVYYRDISSGIISSVEDIDLEYLPTNSGVAIGIIKIRTKISKNYDILIIPPPSKNYVEEIYEQLTRRAEKEDSQDIELIYTRKDEKIIKHLLSQINLSTQTENRHIFRRLGQLRPVLPFPPHNNSTSDVPVPDNAPVINGYVSYSLSLYNHKSYFCS